MWAKSSFISSEPPADENAIEILDKDAGYVKSRRLLFSYSKTSIFPRGKKSKSNIFTYRKLRWVSRLLRRRNSNYGSFFFFIRLLQISFSLNGPYKRY